MVKFLSKHVRSLFIVLLLLCGISVGVAFAATAPSTSNSDWTQAGIVGISIGLIGNAILAGIWIGTTKSAIKTMEKAIDSIGKKRDLDKGCLEKIDRKVATHETKLEDHAKEIDKLRKVQSECKWNNEEPKDFVRKNGRKS